MSINKHPSLTIDWWTICILAIVDFVSPYLSLWLMPFFGILSVHFHACQFPPSFNTYTLSRHCVPDMSPDKNEAYKLRNTLSCWELEGLLNAFLFLRQKKLRNLVLLAFCCSVTLKIMLLRVQTLCIPIPTSYPHLLPHLAPQNFWMAILSLHFIQLLVSGWHTCYIDSKPHLHHTFNYFLQM